MGKIHLTNEMSMGDINSEIRSVFAKAINFDEAFPFTILQSVGSGTKY